MTSEAKLDAFKRTIGQTLQDAANANATPDFAGAPAADMLEHNTRRVALDPVLDALGWSFKDRAEEARVVGDTTLFIDYLGIDRETRTAELIFEAKAWNASWIAGKGKFSGRPPAELVAAAIDHMNGGGAFGNAPVTKEWMERIGQVRDYVVGVEARGGSIVQRAVIGCARWMIIIKDPGRAFVTQKITAGEVLALEATQMVARSDEIYELLSIEALKVAPREPFHPDEIALRVPDPAGIRRLFRAVHVNRDQTTDQYTPQPSIFVNAWLIAERSDGTLLTIRPRTAPIILPASPKFLDDHLEEMKNISDRMLADLERAYNAPMPAPSAIGAFPNFGNDDGGSPVRRSTINGTNYLVATGEAAHYLRDAPNIDCGFHYHEACRMAGMEDEPQPVVARSFELRSFFTTGEAHHCAHRQIKHAKQAVRCPLDVFEAKLCCRACTLQDRCWSEDLLRRAPCGTVPAAA